MRHEPLPGALKPQLPLPLVRPGLHRFDCGVPLPSVSWKSTPPVGVGPALDTVATIVKVVPGKTVPEGPPVSLIVGVNSAWETVAQSARMPKHRQRRSAAAIISMELPGRRGFAVRSRLYHPTGGQPVL